MTSMGMFGLDDDKPDEPASVAAPEKATDDVLVSQEEYEEYEDLLKLKLKLRDFREQIDGDLLYRGLWVACTCGNMSRGEDRGCGACRMYDFLKDLTTPRKLCPHSGNLVYQPSEPLPVERDAAITVVIDRQMTLLRGIARTLGVKAEENS